MIILVEGTVTEVTGAEVVIFTQGIGYLVRTTDETAITLGTKLGETVRLWTYQAVREDALDLFGFSNKEELDFFKLLLRVPGIGPKSALGVLSVAPLNILKNAIAQGNVGYLTKISGIGKKTAEKIVLELREKIGTLGDMSDSPLLREDTDVLEALKSLGYSQEEARDAIKELGPSEGKSVSVRIKDALRVLGTQK